MKQCNRIFKLASKLEKEKLIDEQKQAKLKKQRIKSAKKIKLAKLEQNFENEIDMIKAMIEKEKFEKKIQKVA